MTKKHFIEIAEILRRHDADTQLIKALASYFKQTNPRFDAERFRKAATSIHEASAEKILQVLKKAQDAIQQIDTTGELDELQIEIDDTIRRAEGKE